MKALTCISLFLAAGALAACGGDSDSGPTNSATSEANEQAVSQAETAASSAQDVIAAFTKQLSATGSGQQIQFDAPGVSAPCSALVLVGEDQIATYQGEGGVVTNPAGTVGIQVFEGPPTDISLCLEAAEGVLGDL
jgi:hypothetical protein